MSKAPAVQLLLINQWLQRQTTIRQQPFSTAITGLKIPAQSASNAWPRASGVAAWRQWAAISVGWMLP
jgi:hypothetical protein